MFYEIFFIKYSTHIGRNFIISQYFFLLLFFFRIHLIQFEGCKRFSPVLRRNLVVYTSIGRSHTLSAVIILENYNLINNFLNSPYEISISKISILCSKHNKYDLNMCVYMNNLMLTVIEVHCKTILFTWIIGLTGYKKGGKLVTSACSWSQKICTVTSFQKFALKTGLYKSNCQCKVCNKEKHFLFLNF